MAVLPPTLPAVCTRSIGLPEAPSASARYSSGIITPSNVSGALPMTTASMSVQVISASSRARRPLRGAARPARRRRAPSCGASARPRRPQHRSAISSPSRTQTRFCCRHGPEVAWPSVRRAWPSWIRRAASPMRVRPVAITGLAASGPPEGFTSTSSPSPSAARSTSSSWLKRRRELGHLDRPVPHAGGLAGQAGGLADGEVAQARVVRLDAVVDASDPGRVLAQLAGAVTGDEHDRGRPVGDRRAVPRAKRRDGVGLGQQVVGGDLAGPLGEGVGRARCAGSAPRSRPGRARPCRWPRGPHGPAGRRARRDRPRGASGSTGRSGGRGPRAGRLGTRCRSRRRGRCRRGPTAGAPRPRTSAHAPSISTWDSEIGGQAPVTSRFPTKANDWPAR